MEEDPRVPRAATAPDKPTTYRSKFQPTWCPGCGDYSVLHALDQALQQYARPEHEIAIVSGIGCSSRFPFFMETYGFHSALGRALSVATGLKVARPDLTVIATGGDGDALAIGGNHFHHTMRRNVDLVYILMDNQIYGMTKGQTAPTSLLGMKTRSTPHGSPEDPVDPVWSGLTAGATFVAQTTSFDTQPLADLIHTALNHRGASLINVMAPCVTYNQGGDKAYYRARSVPVPGDHDPNDLGAALELVLAHQGRYLNGIVYQDPDKPTFNQRIDVAREDPVGQDRQLVQELFASHA
jgi:2-oxoglutarate ferredoxin oxidoreductase subunit beta